MLAKNELKSSLAKREMNVKDLAKFLGVNYTTCYRKITYNSFTVKDIDKLLTLFTKDEIVRIFLSDSFTK